MSPYRLSSVNAIPDSQNFCFCSCSSCSSCIRVCSADLSLPVRSSTATRMEEKGDGRDRHRLMAVRHSHDRTNNQTTYQKTPTSRSEMNGLNKLCAIREPHELQRQAVRMLAEDYSASKQVMRFADRQSSIIFVLGCPLGPHVVSATLRWRTRHRRSVYSGQPLLAVGGLKRLVELSPFSKRTKRQRAGVSVAKFGGPTLS